jgi:hypothetical protein
VIDILGEIDGQRLADDEEEAWEYGRRFEEMANDLLGRLRQSLD